MIFRSLVLLILAVVLESRKIQKHQRSSVHHYSETHVKRHQIGHRNTPRFTIPKHDEKSQTSELEPEIINVVKKSGSLKDNDLPGAFGEDESLGDNFYEGSSDSGSGSGSGSNEIESRPEVLNHLVTHDKKAETAANFGNNVVPKPGINPTSAFITKEQNHKGFTGADKSINQNKKKHQKKGKTLNKRIKEKKLKNKMGKVRSLDKSKDKPTSVHHKDTDIIKEIQNIAKQIDAVEKKKKKKLKKEKEKQTSSNITEKVSSYIKKLEKHLKDKVKSTTKTHHKEINGGDEDDGSASSEDLTGKSNLAVAQAGSPEGFECPWVCYWTCHSYCPKECCNNPFHCPRQCKEFCTPYCSDRCCAPGTRRMPKLELNFKTPEETGKRDNNTVTQNKTAELITAQNETTQIAKQLEALKQASYYAAQALGLPNTCPLFCTRICTPGLCKPECCSRSETHRLPQLLAAAAAASSQPSAPAPPPAPASSKPVAPMLPPHPPAPASPVSTVQKAAALPSPPAPAPQQASAPIAPPAANTGKMPPVQANASPQIEGSSINPATIPGLVPETGKGEKIGQFSIRQPNGQIQTFNIESGPIIAVPEGSNAQNSAPQNTLTKTETLSIQAPPPVTSSQRSYCPTPINCPEGNLVDPDYCPPICRTACIDQCPNECCPNYGHAADHQQR